MATIAAGAVQTVTCPAGTGLQFSGGATGLITYLAPGIHPGSSTTLANRNAIGPFSSTQTLSIQVDPTSRPLTYTPTGGAAAANVSQNPLTGALSGPAGVFQNNPPRRILSLKLLQPTSTTANGYSWHMSRSFLADIVAVKVRVHNAATTALTGFSCGIGFSDNVTNQNTPSAGWNAITFSGVSSYTTPITVAAAVSGGGTNSAVLSYLDSDLIYVGSVPRADGVAGSVVHVRGYWATGNGTRASGAAPSATLAADGVWAGFQSGDFVTTNQAGFTSTTYGPGPCIEIIAYTAQDLIYGMSIGDSITLGFEDNLAGGWKRRAVDILAGQGKRVHISDWGASGSTSNAYLTNGLAAIALAPPLFCTFFPGSPNDSDKYTVAGVQRQLSNIATFLSACTTNGVRYPILCTPAPEDGITAPQEVQRRRLVAGVKAAGVMVLDFDQLWTDYSPSANYWLTGYRGTAVVHPNTYADGVAGSYVAAQLATIL